MAKQFFESLVLVLIVVALVFTINPLLLTNIPLVNSVQLDSSILTVLNEKFASSSEEFVLCLDGKIENGVAIINSFTESEVQTQGESQISASCPKKVIATIHNHPNRICSLSLQDSYTLGVSRLPLAGIICGKDNIIFYTPNELKDGLSS